MPAVVVASAGTVLLKLTGMQAMQVFQCEFMFIMQLLSQQLFFPTLLSEIK
jgi:hypothetical protein